MTRRKSARLERCCKKEHTDGHGEDGRDEARDSSFFASGPPSRSTGCPLSEPGCGVRRASRTCGSPDPPEHFLQDGIDDVGVALDEPSVIVRGVRDRLFDYFRVMIPGAFLTIAWCPPLLMCFLPNSHVTVEKTAARFTGPQGGSDPTNFLALKAKKWGRSRPFWCFSTVTLASRVSASDSTQKIAAPTG